MFDFDWDEKKRKTNLTKHGVDFYDIVHFDWKNSFRFIDSRKEYGEVRWVAMGEIEGRLHVCVYTVRQEFYRIITLRKANKKEVYDYETQAFDE